MLQWYNTVYNQKSLFHMQHNLRARYPYVFLVCLTYQNKIGTPANEAKFVILK